MQLIYNVKDKPKFGQLIVFGFQQVLAILAATIAVPTIIGNGMSQSAALFGAGVGTIVYLLFTKFKSPVFLGSSFAFIGSMLAAFAGAISEAAGHFGLIIGALFAGLVYVVIAIAVKVAGVKWINKLMPAVVIGPTVSIIGLSLAGNAVGDLTLGKVMTEVTTQTVENGKIVDVVSSVSTASPYVALICGLITLFTVVICSVSMFGAIFGGCPNTTYGESVGCVAITGNASVVTILATAIMCMIISFFGPFVTFLASIPNCVMGGVCITLYGFIAVSGLKMIQQVDLDDNKNLFVVAVILICGIGGLTVNFGKVTLTSIACALILGIITNVILSKKGKKA